MDGKNVILLLFFCASVLVASAQRQLIILKNEEVLARYQKGDAIHFAREQDKEIQIQKILDMNDTLLMMNLDSVAYYRIKRLDLKGKEKTKFSQKLGGTMILAGVLLPLIQLFNSGVIQDDQPTVSSGVWAVSGALIVTGSALAFIKKPYFKPGRKYRMIIVDKRSPFYKERPIQDGYMSPYIPRN